MGQGGWLYSSVMATLLHRPTSDRRAALALTALVHALLLLGWQAARRLPSPGLDANRDAQRIQWIDLRPPVSAERRTVPPPPAQAPERTRAPEHAPVHAPARVTPAPAAGAVPA